MSHAKNRRIIRARLAGGRTMSGVELNQPGPENAEGLLDTIVRMTKEGELVRNDGSFRLPSNASVRWDGGEPAPTETIAALCHGRSNMIVSIGYTGIKRCYLNIPVEEAIERYMAENDVEDMAGVDCEVISFHDAFGAYEVSE